MQVSQVSIPDIIPYENNPRINGDAIDTVAKSIQEFGFQQPIVVDKEMVIIVGHTRYEAAKRLGYTEVPVVIASELTEEQARAYRIADNKTGELSDWDMKKLRLELKLLDSEFTGFSEKPVSTVFLAEYRKQQAEKVEDYNFTADIHFPIEVMANQRDYDAWQKKKQELGIKKDIDLIRKFLE